MNSMQISYKASTLTALVKMHADYWLTEEGRLIRQAKNGDEQAWWELIMRYQDNVYSMSYRFLLSYDDALEASQETFVAAFRSIDSFNGKSAFKTWLISIAIRTSIKVSKSKTYFVDIENQAVADLSSQTDNPLKEDVANALMRLSDPLRSVIVLREFQGFSYEEIANSLGIAIGTVESRLYRARKKLQKMLKAYAGDKNV